MMKYLKIGAVRYVLLILISCCLFYNCSEKEEQKVENTSNTKETKIDLPAYQEENQSVEVIVQEEVIDTFLIKSQYVDLEITNTDFSINNELFNEDFKDTIVVPLGLGSTIEGISVQYFLKEEYQLISVLQKYETTISLMAEGPHIELFDWKHYLSDWRALTINPLNFETIVYSEKDIEKFPDVTAAEIVAAYEKELGEHPAYWLDLAKQCKSPTSYPCGVGLSRIFIKLILQKDEKMKEQLIIFEYPMGC